MNKDGIFKEERERERLTATGTRLACAVVLVLDAKKRSNMREEKMSLKATMVRPFRPVSVFSFIRVLIFFFLSTLEKKKKKMMGIWEKSWDGMFVGV